ncbi:MULTISPECIES: tyrosine-type recombinase/integrase [Methanobacterium]|uniref:Tyr recombinase domain-containing protein n=1 Tax=Methanobacterium bryantii TaxID=2161 RepID=A0A2A2H923_METBR|nr:MULTISPECIES: site-specific integrase [Methanobacterium]OEC85687.1 hypothetical protein A9507_13095 [Methanobacterium sp. A39]PAV05878.1 hypothetical protein ASJ80_13525 [Methanobacterium bryantii]
MKKSHKVEDEDIFKDFCFDREIRTSTIDNYRNALQKYSNFTNKTLKELIREAEDEEDSGIRLKRRKINKYLRNFKVSLKESDLSESTIELTILLVKSFYRENEIEIPRNNRKSVKKIRRQETIDDLPKMEEIRRFMEKLNSVYKAMTVLCLSSGMGASEVTSLTFKHLYKATSIKPYPETITQLIDQLKAKGNFIPTWNVKRVKRNFEYVTFSSPESIERIINYLEDLQFKFEDYKPQPKDKLFRGLKFNNPLIANDFLAMYTNKNKQYSFRKTENNRNVIRVHSLRKFFASTLEANKIPHLTTRQLLGHNIDSTTSAYFKPDINSLKREYSQIVDKLITTNQDVIIINPYEDIKQEMDTLKGFVLESGKLPEEYRDMILKDQMKLNQEGM